MPTLKVSNLSFSYTPDVPVLKEISLTFDQKATAIIGQNGAGKTTFVKLLKGLLKPSSGRIEINGQNIENVTVAQLSKSIGLVFQNPNDQIFKNKVIDEVMFGPLNIGMDEITARTHAEEALELIGLSEKAADNPYDLGLSERKLIAIASILAMNTEIIIFDEPTIAQDYASKEKIKSIIKKLQEKGKMVLTIIHDMDFVAECFERAVVFSQGEVILDASVREVFSQEQILKKAYLEISHVTKLCKELGYKETYLTVEEFVQAAKVK